jgi:hypothetical protein
MRVRPALAPPNLLQSSTCRNRLIKPVGGNGNEARFQMEFAAVIRENLEIALSRK